jgi:hypothetical protein
LAAMKPGIALRTPKRRAWGQRGERGQGRGGCGRKGEVDIG